MGTLEREGRRDFTKKMPLKGKFAMWEQKAASDTPKGPTMRPSSSMSRAGSRMGKGDDSGSVIGSVAGSEAGPFGPRKARKKKCQTASLQLKKHKQKLMVRSIIN